MVTRRNVLKALAAGCATASAAPVIAATNKSSPVGLRSRVPAHACDCHSHIIGPYNRYPMVESRVYTPPMASVDELKAMHAKLRIERSVLVQPSFYGTDNSCLLDALKELGSTARGVAVIPANPTSGEIDRLRAAGIMGIRINQTGGSKDPKVLRGALEAAGRQAAEQGWCVQAFFPLKTIASLADVIEASPAPFLLDHFAGANATGVQQEGMDKVLGLVKSGKAYVKLSAMYHKSPPPDYPGMAELAAAFVKANPHRVLWATDWPHTNSEKVPGRKKDDISPFYPIDNTNLLAKFFEWVPDDATRKTILVENPAHLFRFA
ncbi:secreted protein [Paraburkholderia unamae]|uniref:amidohydrolase family protein n=1 Tax=Paraburkholderia unamae TaxID=219649 RepID=UPI000DC50214|nr:amidohydrolase family protein [Paraburkholderia unamae]RAR47910.1 secreted protein [Paraburkholderia unamae]